MQPPASGNQDHDRRNDAAEQQGPIAGRRPIGAGALPPAAHQLAGFMNMLAVRRTEKFRKTIGTDEDVVLSDSAVNTDRTLGQIARTVGSRNLLLDVG